MLATFWYSESEQIGDMIRGTLLITFPAWIFVLSAEEFHKENINQANQFRAFFHKTVLRIFIIWTTNPWHEGV